MFKLDLIKEKIDKMRTNIVYSCDNSDQAKLFFHMYIENNITTQYKKYTKNDIFRRNILFYIDVFESYKYIEKIYNDDDKNVYIEKLIHLSWKSDYHLMAYTFDKILEGKCHDVHWEPEDLEAVFTLNDDFSKEIYTFSRWVEMKITYALKFLIESDKLRLIDVNKIPLKGKHKNFVRRSIIKAIEGGAENNSSIIKGLTLFQKINLLSSLNVDPREKLFSFNLDSTYIDMDEQEANKLFLAIITTLNNIRLFRNKISHNEFILNRRNLTEFKMMTTNFSRYGFAFCEEPQLRIGSLEENLFLHINDLLSKFNKESKREKIKKYFNVLE